MQAAFNWLLARRRSANGLKARSRTLWSTKPQDEAAATNRTRAERRLVRPPSLSERQAQPGRNHGKGPGKRWDYCPGILPPVADAHCLTGGLVSPACLGTSAESRVQFAVAGPTADCAATGSSDYTGLNDHCLFVTLYLGTLSDLLLFYG